MLISTILPVLYACVLGADESVLQLAPNSTVALPFIDIQMSQSDLHADDVIQEESSSPSCESDGPVAVLHLAPNTAFTVPFIGLRKPQSIFHGNVALREGSTSHPCEIGEPCYQSLTDREYAFVGGSPNGGKGIIVAYPVDKSKSPSALIVQKKGETSADSSIPVGVGLAEIIERETTFSREVLILYGDRVQDTTINENIEFVLGDYRPMKRYVYLAPYLHEDIKGRTNLVLTGRLGKTPMEYKLMSSNFKCTILRLVPGDAPDWYPTTIRVAFSGVHHLQAWKLLICFLPAFLTTTMP